MKFLYNTFIAINQMISHCFMSKYNLETFYKLILNMQKSMKN